MVANSSGCKDISDNRSNRHKYVLLVCRRSCVLVDVPHGVTRLLHCAYIPAQIVTDTPPGKREDRRRRYNREIATPFKVFEDLVCGNLRIWSAEYSIMEISFGCGCVAQYWVS